MSGWHKEDINAAIRKRCGSLKKFGEMIDVPAYQVRRSVIMAVPLVDLAVSEYIGRPPAELWPARYGPNGTHVRQLNRLIKAKEEASSKSGKSIPHASEGVAS
jgi:lambda repressor-like predicted transcriptional regulator